MPIEHLIRQEFPEMCLLLLTVVVMHQCVGNHSYVVHRHVMYRVKQRFTMYVISCTNSLQVGEFEAEDKRLTLWDVVSLIDSTCHFSLCKLGMVFMYKTTM